MRSGVDKGSMTGTLCAKRMENPMVGSTLRQPRWLCPTWDAGFMRLEVDRLLAEDKASEPSLDLKNLSQISIFGRIQRDQGDVVQKTQLMPSH